MNKTQKIIITVWIVVLSLCSFNVLNEAYSVFIDGHNNMYLEDAIKSFIALSFVISTPAFILFNIWKDKK